MAKRKTANSDASNSEYQSDVLVVGGGIAGLYFAWRKSQLDPGKTITVIEYQKYIFESIDKDSKRKDLSKPERINFGGRIFSQFVQGVAIPAEMGAMRFSTRHLLLKGLIEEFNLETKPVSGLDPSYFLRGRRLNTMSIRNSECHACAASLPYSVRPEEKKKLPAELVCDAIWQLLEAVHFEPNKNLNVDKIRHLRRVIDRRKMPSEKEWREIKRYALYRNTHLYDVGFWNVLQHFLSNEAFLFIHDGIGYESIIGNWSAAEAIAWFLKDFDPQQELRRIRKGFGELIREIYRELSKNPNVTLVDGTELRSLHKEKTGWTAKCLKFDNSETTYVAGSVILALPSQPMTELSVHGSNKSNLPGWDSLIEHARFIKPHRLFKLFMVFDNPWWYSSSMPGSKSGKVLTDLPIRQVYYYDAAWIQEFAHVDKIGLAQSQVNPAISDRVNLSLIMASYSDEHYVSFWEPFTKYSGSDVNLGNAIFYRAQPNLWSSRQVELDLRKEVKRTSASERMVQKVRQQLAELHNVTHDSIPEPVAAIMMDWGQKPFGGGWHTWEVNARPWDFAVDAQQELGESGLYICGEAFSDEQGWIEGSLRSVEQIFQHFPEMNAETYEPPHWMNDQPIEEYLPPFWDSANAD